ncbi:MULTISPECIES: response regulator transcription factor [Stenotrophomonas]|uniref:XRE family transcriptional regulator n=1 Tax=Stenotrophomonas nitritireducens TaxID=83617 RepID=A0ABR5NJ54_9GAMM|nr:MULTISPECIES: response regulator transcription factor [Stenotrophomonas]KQO00230.1 XRE family transcriptional regulator [Stenotrophomonas sp. Leaf70]KRG56873.1 XRE family transcriptional regulator [Stenotrophomonas nitritireducens]MBN8791533.1 response regulator transcription factor [Stenotrophomonas nitritireducens]MBN8795472.1 response regulator transcription factor [Stenotrophomonas nitritireducens]
MRILVVEDDTQISAFIAKGLREDGHVVDCVDNGRDGLFMATTEAYAAVVLDRMLPGLDGLTVLRTLRGAGNAVPVLLLTALADVDHRVEGLRAGADDYLVKPFAFAELSARLDGLSRRSPAASQAAPSTRLQVADLELDLLRRAASRGGRAIELLPREFMLLEYLMRNAGRVVTRTMLLESVWNYHFDPQTNVIDVHISRLRQKIDHGFATPLLHTVRGAGYRLGD